MSSPSLEDALSPALAAHRNGRLAEAEALCRALLETHPHAVPVLQRLGLIALQTGRSAQACAWLQQARDQSADDPETLRLFAQALFAAGHRTDALACLRRRTEVLPQSAEAWIDFAVVSQQAGDLDEALRAYGKASRLQPGTAALHANLGGLLRRRGRPTDARAALETALQLEPNLAEAHALMARVWQDLGDLPAAERALRQARGLVPGLLSAHLDLGNLLLLSGRAEEALQVLDEALSLLPHQAELHLNRGTALRARGLVDEAERAFQRAVELAPQLPAAHNNLANAWLDQGRLREALDGFQRASELAPHEPSYFSNRILALHYDEETLTSLPAALTEWNRRWCPAPKVVPPRRPASPGSSLRVGLISPDFREHPVGRFLAGLFDQARASGLDLIVYSDVVREDALTARLRSGASLWRPCAGLGDAEVAAQIERDGIDVLIDLALHTSGNRLPLFCRRPAPVQVSYLGYPGGPGLEAIPFRLTDALLDPPGVRDTLHPETPVRLESPYWCYTPPDLAPIPEVRPQRFTFGHLGNPCKVTRATLDAWALILQRCPDAAFVLHAPSRHQREPLLAAWARRGIARERITFVGRLPLPDYLQQCARLDLVLDTFPFNGATTTCDALWMGTPVLTLAGRHACHRSGASLLGAAGLEADLTYSIDAYVSRACAHATAPGRDARQRAKLREHLRTSPLMDAPAFARAFSRALRALV